jgi:hypothetical protein
MRLLLIGNYLWTFLQLHYFGFHPKKTTYVPLVANVTNLIVALEYTNKATIIIHLILFLLFNINILLAIIFLNNGNNYNKIVSLG